MTSFSHQGLWHTCTPAPSPPLSVVTPSRADSIAIGVWVTGFGTLGSLGDLGTPEDSLLNARQVHPQTKVLLGRRGWQRASLFCEGKQKRNFTLTPHSPLCERQPLPPELWRRPRPQRTKVMVPARKVSVLIISKSNTVQTVLSSNKEHGTA